MAIVYNPYDVFVARRNANSSSFEEKVLSSVPNSVVMFDSSSTLIAITSSQFTVISSSYSSTSSYALNGGSFISTGSTYPITASWSEDSILAMYAISASWSSASISSSYSLTASYASYASYASNGIDSIVTGSTYPITSSWSVTSSFAESYNPPTGTPTYFPNWDVSGSLSSTSVLKTDGTTLSVNEAIPSSGPGSSPEALSVKAYDNEYNAVKIVGTVDNYLQVNLQNKNFGSQASTDFIATADDGTEDNNYIDVGVNSATYDVADFALQKAHDGYVYVNGGNLIVGTYTTGSLVKIHAGGLQQNNLIAILSEQHGFEASGSFYGTASYGIHGLSSSFSETASYFNQLWLNTGSTYPITSSWSEVSSLSITSSNSNSSSYIIPGATLYVVSGSNGVPPSFIEPYDLPVVPYNPSFKEGRMFYDSDFHNWVYYPEQNFKLHIGKEVIWRVHNPYSYTLPATTAVYISGSLTGILPDVYKAIADGTNTKSDVVGIIRSDIESGSFGYILVNGIIHNVNVGSFQIGDKVWLSNTVEGGFLNSEPGQPYESIRIGTCQEAGSNGSIALNIIQFPPPSNAYAGLTSIVTVTDNTASNVLYISTGSVNLFDNIEGRGVAKGYPLTATTFSVTVGQGTQYIVARYAAGSASYDITTDQSLINETTVVPVTIVYRADIDTHHLDYSETGLALANKIHQRLQRTQRFARESGLTLAQTGSRYFTVTEGSVWYGATNVSVTDFDSRVTYSLSLPVGYDETHYVYHSASVLVIPTGSGQFVNSHYDNGTDLTPLSSGSYTVNYFYRILGDNDIDEDVFIVLGDNQYSNVLEAQGSKIPANIPAVLSDVSILVGRMIVQSGSNSAALVESAFTNDFGISTVTNHESLAGLQGGQGGQHYHLTLTEYGNNLDGPFIRERNGVLDNPTFVAATPYHIPYWDTSGHLTLTGSVQVNQGQYVLINSASVTTDNPEALLVKQINTSSVNTIGAYSNVNNYSQIYNQNLSSGSNASTDIVATNDTGSQTTNYIDMGVASSQYNDSRWPWLKPSDCYVEVDGGDLWIGTLTDNVIRFMINNTASVGYIGFDGIHVSGSLFGTSSNSISSSRSITSSYSLDITSSINHDFNINGTLKTNANILQAQLGNTIPFYITANWPSLGFNAYWDSVWKYGAGSSGNYGGFQTFDVRDGQGHMDYWMFPNTGSEGQSGNETRVLSFWHDGRIEITSFTQSGLVKTDSNGFLGIDLVTYQPQIQTGSLLSITSSVSTTSSYSLTSSYLPVGLYNITSSWSINYTGSVVNNQLPAQINVTGITSSFTGSLKGNVIGTSSFATNANTTTNLGLTAYNISVTYASQSNWSVSASFASSSVTSSYLPDGLYNFTSSWSNNSLTSSYLPVGLYNVTTSWSNNSLTSSLSDNSLTASYLPAGLYNVTASWANNSLTSSYLPVGLYNFTSSWSNNSLTSSLSNNSLTASYLPDGLYNFTSSWSTKSLTSSYLPVGTYNFTSSWSNNSLTSSYLPVGLYNVTTSWSNNSLTSSYLPDGLYNVTTSWSNNSLTSSYLPTGLYNFTSSWANNSLTASSINFIPNISNTSSYVSGSNVKGIVESSSYSITSSYSVSSSYSLSSSWAPVWTLTTGSSYEITSSWSTNSRTSSYSLGVPTIKSGIISGSLFAGTPRTGSVSFINVFPNNNYSVTVTGEQSRTWTIQGKTANGFTINSNNNTAMTGLVFWQAIIIGEFYS